MRAMAQRYSRRAALRVGLAAAALPALGALGCAGTGAGAAPATTGRAAPAAPTFEPVIVTTEQVVGKNRFSLALVNPESGPITDAGVTVRFYKVDQRAGTAQLRLELPAPYHGAGLEDKGVYVAYPEFDEPGAWGLEVIATPPGRREPLSPARTNFTVLRQSAALPVGAVAPRTRQPLAGEPLPGSAPLCTASPPCDLHSVRIADSIAAGRPSLILFAAPGWCPSQTCAPELNVVQQLRSTYGDRIDFSHVEIYKDADHTELADAVREWRLTTEPWVFLVDRTGTITARFEGGATADEIEPFLQRLVA